MREVKELDIGFVAFMRKLYEDIDSVRDVFFTVGIWPFSVQVMAKTSMSIRNDKIRTIRERGAYCGSND